MNELILGIQLGTLLFIYILYIFTERKIMAAKDELTAAIAAAKKAISDSLTAVGAEVDRVVQLVTDLKGGALSAADLAELKTDLATDANVQKLADLKLQLEGATQ